jgi:hypothetical protein
MALRDRNSGRLAVNFLLSLTRAYSITPADGFYHSQMTNAKKARPEEHNHRLSHIHSTPFSLAMLELEYSTGGLLRCVRGWKLRFWILVLR